MPDPIAFIYVFAIVLHCLVSFDVVRRRKDDIYEVMGELAGIIGEDNPSSWLRSRQRCLSHAFIHFDVSDLTDTQLIPKLTNLILT